MAQRSESAKERNALIKAEIDKRLAERPPGPNRPLTRERVIGLRDLCMQLYPGGTKGQTLSVVTRRCAAWGKQKATRSKPVTGGANLDMAVQILSGEDMGSTRLYWAMIKRDPGMKLSPRSCLTLKQRAMQIIKKRQVQVRFERALQRPKVLKWSKLVKEARRLKLVKEAERLKFVKHVCSDMVHDLTMPLVEMDRRERELISLRNRPLFRQPATPDLFETYPILYWDYQELARADYYDALYYATPVEARTPERQPRCKNRPGFAKKQGKKRRNTKKKKSRSSDKIGYVPPVARRSTLKRRSSDIPGYVHPVARRSTRYGRRSEDYPGYIPPVARRSRRSKVKR